VGFPYTSLPLEGGRVRVGVIKMLVFTLPLIPSPQGRGDFKIACRLCGEELH